MAHGSWLMAHGSWLMAHGSWLILAVGFFSVGVPGMAWHGMAEHGMAAGSNEVELARCTDFPWQVGKELSGSMKELPHPCPAAEFGVALLAAAGCCVVPAWLFSATHTPQKAAGSACVSGDPIKVSCTCALISLSLVSCILYPVSCIIVHETGKGLHPMRERSGKNGNRLMNSSVRNELKHRTGQKRRLVEGRRGRPESKIQHGLKNIT